MASKQSGRDIVPKVENLINVKTLSDRISEFDLVLLAYENENEKSLKKELEKIKGTKDKLKLAIIIGPEGGIDETEVENLITKGAKSVSLGKRILRTETAPLAMSAIIMYDLES